MSKKHTKETFFQRCIIQKNGCWDWIGCLTHDGYAQVRYHGKTALAHRISYQLSIGEIKPGLEIDHLCRNRKCINPKHLEVVTHQVNVDRGDYKINGTLIAAFHQNKTHCPKGHPYSGDNLKIRLIEGHEPHRECRICRRDSEKRRKAFLKEDKRLEKILESGIW